jgi:N6-L-threonylcarbamoyladenine synthase
MEASAVSSEPDHTGPLQGTCYTRVMLTLGIESSCDETGVALYDTEAGLLAQALHSQVAMHEQYGGVVPELASRDHIRRVVPLTRQVLSEAGRTLADIDAIAYTEGPGLAGALLVGAAVGSALGLALGKPTLGVHHLEGHLLSPLLSADPPAFPFVALLVSGGHTQLLRVDGVGAYHLLGESVDDAAGEAFDKSAKLLGLGYPGGPALARLAEQGTSGRFGLPRPKLHSGDLDFSFSGLKTAVATRIARGLADDTARADLAAEVQTAIVDVLVAKSVAAVRQTSLATLVIAGGVSANRVLRERLATEQARHGFRVHFPEPALCTDNGAMIAFAGALRLQAMQAAGTLPVRSGGFDIRPRWPLEQLTRVASSPQAPKAP